MEDEIKPKPYSTTDTSEILAIKTFEGKVDSRFVKTYITKRDKTPNIDGYIEIVDDKQVPLGKFDVQIKKIPKDATKFSCEIELFAYATMTTSPLILVCVDVDNLKVFWKQIKREMAVGKETQKSITIYFASPDDEIDGMGSSLYLSRWSSIIYDYQERVQNYQTVVKQLEEVSKYVSPFKDLSKLNTTDITSLQIFIDKLNHLLDFEYKLIKRIFFKDIWKIGIAVHSYNTEQVVYSLFSVRTGSPDSLIKYVTLSDADIFKSGPYGFLSAWHRPNDIRSNPEKVANEIVYSKLKEIVKNKILSINNEYLCREYLFDFIDENFSSLGLEQKDLYSVKELQVALYSYFPRWCFVALEHINYPKHLKHFDASIIRMFLAPEMYKEVSEETLKMITDSAPFPPFMMGSLFFSLRTVYESLAYFLDKDIKEIGRIYKTRDPSIKRPSGWIWEGYKQETLDYNALILLNNFEKTYNGFIEANELDGLKFNLFEDCDRILYLYDLKEKYEINEHPILKTYYLKLIRGAPAANRVECFNLREFKLKLDQTIDLNGNKYEILSSSMGTADFFFHRTPMLNLIYKHLSRKIKELFRK